MIRMAHSMSLKASSEPVPALALPACFQITALGLSQRTTACMATWAFLGHGLCALIWAVFGGIMGYHY